MDYKIWISFKIDPPQPLSGTPFNIQLTLHNIGESLFPGGLFKKLDVSVKGNLQSMLAEELEKIPPIKPEEFVVLKPIGFLQLASGVAWVRAIISSSDGGKVQHFQSAVGNLGEEWGNNFVIKDQDTITVIKLLERIAQLLEKKEKT